MLYKLSKKFLILSLISFLIPSLSKKSSFSTNDFTPVREASKNPLRFLTTSCPANDVAASVSNSDPVSVYSSSHHANTYTICASGEITFQTQEADDEDLEMAIFDDEYNELASDDDTNGYQPEITYDFGSTPKIYYID